MEQSATNKVIGYSLIVIGLFLIAFTMLNIYDVFQGRVKPFPLFNFQAISLDFSKMVEQAPPGANLSQELVASNLLNDPMNFTAHLLMMGFIASGGFKIASIGVMMVRTIKVNVKEEKQSILTPRNS